jgi:hypothetical protein
MHVWLEQSYLLILYKVNNLIIQLISHKIYFFYANSLLYHACWWFILLMQFREYCSYMYKCMLPVSHFMLKVWCHLLHAKTSNLYRLYCNILGVLLKMDSLFQILSFFFLFPMVPHSVRGPLQTPSIFLGRQQASSSLSSYFKSKFNKLQRNSIWSCQARTVASVERCPTVFPFLSFFVFTSEGTLFCLHTRYQHNWYPVFRKQARSGELK